MSNPPAPSERVDGDLGARLTAIEDRLDAIQSMLDAAARKAEVVESTFSTTVNVVDATAQRLQAKGVNLDERVARLIDMSLQLTTPENMQMFEAVLSRRQEFIQLMAVADQMPGLVATLVNSVDMMMARLMARGVQPVALERNVSDSIERLLVLLQSHEFKALVSSGALDPTAFMMAAEAAQAFREAAESPAKPMGVFGAMRAASDDDVKRLIGFSLQVAKNLGRLLQKRLPSTQPRDQR